MSPHIKHIGKRSWWDGTFRSLCGLVVPGCDTQPAGWFDRLCPGCKAVRDLARGTK